MHIYIYYIYFNMCTYFSKSIMPRIHINCVYFSENMLKKHSSLIFLSHRKYGGFKKMFFLIKCRALIGLNIPGRVSAPLIKFQTGFTSQKTHVLMP